MGTIIVSENVTLDGVVQDPAGDEGFRHGGWVGLISNSPQLGKLALDEALGQEAFLLGRRSYEWLAARWASRSGERLISSRWQEGDHSNEDAATTFHCPGTEDRPR